MQEWSKLRRAAPAVETGTAPDEPGLPCSGTPLHNGRGWLGVLLGLPLASLLALLGTASLRPVPASQSGDALLDAFYRDFDARGRLPWSARALEPAAAGVAQNLDLATPFGRLRPSSLLERIEEDFTADPRYWRLLFIRAALSPPAAEAQRLRRAGISENAWFLEEARRRGVADVPLLIKLLEMYDNPWLSAANANVPTPTSPESSLSKQARDWPRERWSARQSGFAAASAQQLDPLLAELLRQGAKDAAAHYTAARLLCAAGRLPEAHAELATGNRCSWSSNFTALSSRSFWHSAQQPPRLWAVEEQALGDYFARSLPDYIQWKDLVKQLALDAAERGDRRALTELHRFACRFSRDNPILINQLVGLVMCGNVEIAAKSFSRPPLSEAQHQTLSQLASTRGKLRAEIKSVAAALDALLPVTAGGPDPDPAQWLLAGGRKLLSAGDAACIDYLNYKQRMVAAEAAAYEQKLEPLWQQLAGFDYALLDAAAAPED